MSNRECIPWVVARDRG